MVAASLTEVRGDARLYLGERQAGCGTAALPWPCSKAGYPRAELAQPVLSYPSRLRPAWLPSPAPSLPSPHGLLSLLSLAWLGGRSRGAAVTSLSLDLGCTVRTHTWALFTSQPCQAGAGFFRPFSQPYPAAPWCDGPVACVCPSPSPPPSFPLSLLHLPWGFTSLCWHQGNRATHHRPPLGDAGRHLASHSELLPLAEPSSRQGNFPYNCSSQ